MSRLDGSNRLILINTEINSPRCIVVFPKKGYIFWTDWGSKDPKIERAFMNGDNRTVLVNKEKMKSVNNSEYSIAWPNGITIDYDAELLYWVDAKTDILVRMTLDGSE